MEKPVWTDRLGAVIHLAPDVARGVRGVLAMLVPFFVGRKLGSDELAWAALGGWLCTIGDPGGPRSSRATTLVSFTLAGTLLVLIGEAAARTPAGALLAIGAVAFGASLFRAAGATASSLSTPCVVVMAVAVGDHPADPIPHALGFAAGAAWAVGLSSMFWPVWALLPLRVGLGAAWRALAGYVRAVASAIDEELPPHDPRWTALARAQQRNVRAAIDAAASAALALRARRSGESALGSNLLVLLGVVDAQHRLLVAFADEIEVAYGSARRARAAAVLVELAATYEAIAEALTTPRRACPSRLEEAPPEVRDQASALGRRLLEASAAASRIAAHPGTATTADATSLHLLVGHAVRNDLRAFRDALALRSTYFRHAVRVTIAVVVAQAVGQLLSPHHVAWITVTTAAVLQPYPGVTVTRAIERALGTVAGGIVALVVIVFVHSPLVLMLLLVPFGIAAVAIRPRSHRLFVFFLTPLFILLAERWQGDWWTAAARVGDALVGATIALVAALVFPSREQPRLVDALGAVLDALRSYAVAVIDAHVGRRSGSPDVLAARRDFAATMGTAEASLERSLSEPLRPRRQVEAALMLVTYARRLASSLTALDVSHASPADGRVASEVASYVRAVVEALVHRREPPSPPEIDSAVAAHELLGRIVRQAELLGSRCLPPRLSTSSRSRGQSWAARRRHRTPSQSSAAS